MNNLPPELKQMILDHTYCGTAWGNGVASGNTSQFTILGTRAKDLKLWIYDRQGWQYWVNIDYLDKYQPIPVMMEQLWDDSPDSGQVEGQT
jgi:hypothetical protein